MKNEYIYYRVKIKEEFLPDTGDRFSYYRIKKDNRYRILRGYNKARGYFPKTFWRGIGDLVQNAKWYDGHTIITEDEFNRYLLIEKLKQ